MSNFTNSDLISLTRLSPNRNSPRNQPISKITIHHFAGNSTIEGVSNFLANPARQASYNYGIGSDGRIVLIVDERDRCWGSSSAWNDNRAVVIGVANNSGAPNWTVSDAAFESLIDLCVDICRRNPGIKQLNGKSGLWYDGTQNGSLTRHNMFSNQVCPGPFLQKRFQTICNIVNKKLSNGNAPPQPTTSAYPIAEENIRKMVDLNVINSPDFWRNVDSVRWLNELLARAGQQGDLHKNVDNGIFDLEIALKVLEMAGIVNTPGYWLEQAVNGNVQFLDQLIINIANRCLDPLHRIVWAEARGEDLRGQALVAEVVLNRHNSSQFPNGIYNVIHQSGINSQGKLVHQFAPVANGAYDRATPTEMNKRAVSEALSGVSHSHGALFFRTIRGAEGSWHQTALTHLFDHGGHRFFR